VWRNGFKFRIYKNMEGTREEARLAEQRQSNVSQWPSDFVGKFGSVSLETRDETLNNKESPRLSNQDFMSPQRASQILWHTGMLSEPIPNGFYSVVPVRIDSHVTLLVRICNCTWYECTSLEYLC
jgi:hypothetical protein